MIKFSNQLRSQMERELDEVAMQSEREALKCKVSFEVVSKALAELRKFMHAYEFRDEEEEVRFFKEIKPSFQHLAIYYCELAYVQTARPIGDNQAIILFLQKAISNNHDFLERHELLYSYYRLGHTAEDSRLFVRNGLPPSVYPLYNENGDPTFSSQSSEILSKLLAFEKLNEYYSRQIEQLKKGPEQTISPIDNKKYNLVWTDSKANFVELVYGIFSSGAANFGKVDINQLMQGLESIFNIHIDNPYRTFTDLSNRKKERTPFIDNMKSNLEKKMDDRL